MEVRKRSWKEAFADKIVTADEAVAGIRPGQRVFVGSGAGEPQKLVEAPLRDLFYRLSPESIHYRFFQQISAMPHERLQEFLKIDYEADMALVVLTSSSEEDAEMLAIAHYLKDPRSNFAEAAFLVRDDWHGRGIGTQLMKALVEAAQLHGLAGFTAEVLAANQGMLKVFHRCGFQVESKLEEQVYSLRIPFQKPS